MKLTFRIIKMCVPNGYKQKAWQYYIIQKRGWFGWKTFETVMDAEWGSHYSYSYWPGDVEKFRDKRSARLFILTHHGRRGAHVCQS